MIVIYFCDSTLYLILFAGEVNFTKLATELYNTSGATNILLRQLLQLPDLEDETSETTGLSAGITAAIVIAVAVAVGIVVAVAVLVVVFVKRYMHSRSCNSVWKCVCISICGVW